MTDTEPEQWTDDPDEAEVASDLIPKDPADGKCMARTNDGNYCGQAQGWGTDHPGSGRCKFHGGNAGAPSGPANGNWRHGLYSEHMSDADAERVEEWLELADGERLSLDEFTGMFEKLIVYEMTRLERAMGQAPDPDRSHKWACAGCGAELYAGRSQEVCPACERNLSPDDVVAVAEWVDMHDQSVSKRAQALSEMIQTYKEVTEGSDVNVRGELDVNYSEALQRAQEMAESVPEPADEDTVEFLAGEAPDE